MADNRPMIGVEVVGNLGDQSNIVDLNLIAGGAISTGTATVRVTTNRIMGVKSSQPEGTYTGGVIFTATANDGPVLPKPEDKSLDDIVYMQDMTPDICAKSVENETKWLIDERDGNQYYVAKLKDGNCWMTQNLALDLSTKKTLTPRDTDITTDYTPTRDMDTVATQSYINYNDYAKVDLSWNLNNGGKWTYATPNRSDVCPRIPGATNDYETVAVGGTFADLNCNNRYVEVSGSEWTADGNYGTGSGTNLNVVDATNKTYNPHYLAGNLYSYSAATAKTGDNIASGNASGSICPRGWTLPNGQTDGADRGLATLTNLYGRNYTNLADAPLYFTRAGYLYILSITNTNTNSTFHRLGAVGILWTSTASSADRAVRFAASYTASDLIASSAFRGIGGSVRCVAR